MLTTKSVPARSRRIGRSWDIKGRFGDISAPAPLGLTETYWCVVAAFNQLSGDVLHVIATDKGHATAVLKRCGQV